MAQWASFGEYMGSSNGIDVSGLSSQYGYALHGHRMRTACAPHVHCMGTACAPHAHRMCTAWALHVHCMRTACALHAHYMRTICRTITCRREQFEYIMQTSQWCQVQGAEIIGGTFEVIDFSLETVDIEELRC